MQENDGPVEIAITPKNVLVVLIGITGLLLAFHLIGLYLRFGLGHDYALGFVPLFNLDSEQNAPTLFNSMLLVGAGVLCFVAATTVPRFRWRWRFIALVFIILGIDETFGFHEPLFFVLRGNQSAGTASLVEHLGGLVFSDLVPWISIICVVLFAWFWPLVRYVERSIIVTGAIASMTYLAGAVGLDFLTAVERAGELSLATIIVLGTLEEILELVGASLFIYAILRYLAEMHRATVRLCPNP